MGVVWAAVNELVDGEVALKLLQSKNPELRRRLLREAKACGRLAHPNIVKVYDVGETSEGDPFLVMELLRGETLAERLRRERTFPPTTAVGIAIDVARALRVAHDAGVIHRDLKPANIFLYRESDDDHSSAIKLKVLDFGVSKLAIENESTATVSGTLLGSPAYMSPEQAQALPIDGRADLWSLGVVLFEMLAGVRPFQSRSMTGVLAELLNKPIPRLESMAPGIDPHLSDVVASCLERDLELRVKDAEELIARLRPFASPRDDLHSSWEGIPVPAVFVPPPAGAPPPRPVALSVEALTVLTPAKAEDGEEYEPTSLYQKSGEPGAAGLRSPNRAISESQRPTLELPPPLAGGEMLPPPIPAAPRLPEDIGAALSGAAGPPRAPSRPDAGEAPVPPSTPLFGAPPATISTLSTTPVSHGPPAGLPRVESIPPPFRRMKLDGMAPLIAIGASLGIAIAVVVVLTSGGSSHDIGDLTPTSSSAIEPPAAATPPAPPTPPPPVAESAQPAPSPSSTASASTPPKAPTAPVRPPPLRPPPTTPTTKKPSSPGKR